MRLILWVVVLTIYCTGNFWGVLKNYSPGNLAVVLITTVLKYERCLASFVFSSVCNVKSYLNYITSCP